MDYFRKPGKIFVAGAPFVILAGWFLAKVFQFQTLNENFSDGLIALQLSRGWLDGRPFLYDNYFGFHSRLHNYYILGFIGPLTRFAGIYGFFILYLGLLAALFGMLLHWLRRFDPVHWKSFWFAFLVFAMGPFTFNTYLDLYGWHPEQYFLPLMCLLSFCLARRQWIASIVCIMLIASVKETSGVLLCVLLLFISQADYILKYPGDPWYKALVTQRNVIIFVAGLLFFVGGMYLLSYMNGPQPSRLGQAFTHVYRSGSPGRFMAYLFEIALATLASFLIALLAFIPWLRNTPKKGLIVTMLSAYYLVLATMFFVEGLYYYPSYIMSLPYPARFLGLWAFMISSYIFIVVKRVEQGHSVKSGLGGFTLLSLCLQLFFTPILIHRDGYDPQNLHGLVKKLALFAKHDFGLSPYSDPNEKVLSDLAQKLPRGTEVIAPLKYLPIFQRVYACERKGKDFMLNRPLVCIIQKDSVQELNDPILKDKSYEVIPNDNLLILIDSKWKTQSLK